MVHIASYGLACPAPHQLDTGELDSAITLGVKPVGAVEAVPGMGLPEYLGEKTRGIELVGTIEQPNLEKIAALDPDLFVKAFRAGIFRLRQTHAGLGFILVAHAALSSTPRPNTSSARFSASKS